nr:MAG TPA: hypothetical protein [Bacteriophage sp.]
MLCVHCYHQAALNRSAIFACMVFRMMLHLRCLWLQILVWKGFVEGFFCEWAIFLKLRGGLAQLLQYLIAQRPLR